MREIPSFIWTTHALEILSISDHVESNLSSLETYFPWCPNDGQNAMEIYITYVHSYVAFGLYSSLRRHGRYSRNATFITPPFNSSMSSKEVHSKAHFSKPTARSCRSSRSQSKEFILNTDSSHGSGGMCLRPAQTIQSFHSHVYHLPVYSASDPFKNESLTELKLLMRVKDIGHGGLDSKMPKQAVYDKLLSIIKDRTCFLR